AEAAVLDVPGVPVDGLVGGQQVVLAGRGGDVPARFAPVDERGTAPPAMRVRVRIGVAAEQEPFGLQPVVDGGVGGTDLLAAQPVDVVGEGPVGSDGIEGRQAVGSADVTVDLTEGRGQVDQPGALIGGDVVGRDDPPAVGPHRDGQVVEGPGVTQADQIG